MFYSSRCLNIAWWQTMKNPEFSGEPLRLEDHCCHIFSVCLLVCSTSIATKPAKVILKAIKSFNPDPCLMQVHHWHPNNVVLDLVYIRGDIFQKFTQAPFFICTLTRSWMLMVKMWENALPSDAALYSSPRWPACSLSELTTRALLSGAFYRTNKFNSYGHFFLMD